MYINVWKSKKTPGKALTEPLTMMEKQQQQQPYGHGIGIAYYQSVLGNMKQSEQTLLSLIEYAPEEFGADNELAMLYKSQGRLEDLAEKALERAYARGGDEDTNVVVSYAAMKRLYGETDKSAADLTTTPTL